MNKFFRIFLLGLLFVFVAAGWKAWQTLPMATGYIAKTMCSEYFVAGRTNLDNIWSDIQNIDSLFGWGSYEIDGETRQVSGYFGPGLSRTVAVYRDGLGCTIAANVDPDLLGPLPPLRSYGSVEAQSLAASETEHPALESALDDAFAEPSATSKRQSRAIVILHRGRIVAERYAEEFDKNTPLIGWSMTKSITNTLIGMLVGDGLLELDEPAPVPEWQSQDDPRRKISLRNLLQMSSGLDFEEVYKPGSDATNMLFTEFSTAAYAAASPLVHDPGTHWSYSSGTSNILGRIIRDTVGGTVADVHEFTRKRLIEPLGLSSLVIEPDASGSFVGSSFSYATARDWARLGQFWLQDGQWGGQRLLPEGWMAWSVSPAPAAPKGEYGAQFWLNAGMDGKHHRFPGLPDDIFSANGFAGQSVVVFPDQEIVAVRLGLTTDNSWSRLDFLTAVYLALN